MRKMLLRLALGKRAYEYMVRTLECDPRIRTARTVDVVVRKDAVEQRIEADWLKNIARIVLPKPQLDALRLQRTPGVTDISAARKKREEGGK